MSRIAKPKNPQPNMVASLDFNKAKLLIAADTSVTCVIVNSEFVLRANKNQYVV
jgi:hypothetical protein